MFVLGQNIGAQNRNLGEMQVKGAASEPFHVLILELFMYFGLNIY